MAEHFRDPMSSTVPSSDGHKLWDIIDANELGYKLDGIRTKSWFLRLQSHVSWYFYELGHSFRSPQYQKRPLYVYTDLVETQVVGGSETDLLREVTYDDVQGENRKVKNTYEPKNLQFLPVRKNKFDTVEIGISEVDGTQTRFLDHMGETIVTLCFRRQNVDNSR